ncbi:hypothetical protein AURDEDRAFT_111255 [Auricularia subglabra TFB-10046 SS5]|nr:hypothetical protein AURDEDRAFT_111255 [Auricularia subglabra TFB-10046 SS5]
MAPKSRRSPPHASVPPSPQDAQTPAPAADADTDAVPAQPIPRPPNAWILYRSDKVRQLESEAGPSKPRRPQAEISKEIAAMWKAEPNDVLTYWSGKAEIEKALHAVKYPNYRFTPRKKEDKLRDKELVKARKAKERSDAGGCKRTKARRVTSSPKTEPSPESATPKLDASMRPPHFTMGPPEGTSPIDLFGFDTAIPQPTFSPSGYLAPMPQLQSPAPIAGTSQLPTLDLTGLDGNVDLAQYPPSTWYLPGGPLNPGNMDVMQFAVPQNSFLSPSPNMPIPAGWQPDQDTLGSQAHPVTRGLLSGQIIGGSEGLLFIDGISEADVAANPYGEIELCASDNLQDNYFQDLEAFANSFLNTFDSLESDSQGLPAHDSPASQPTPALSHSHSTPAAQRDFVPTWNTSPSHHSDAASAGPLTPPAFIPRHADNSAYVPPSGATFAGSRRVGGSWATAINAR